MEVTSLPEKHRKIYCELSTGESATFFLSVNLPQLVDDEVHLTVDKAPSGWRVAFSTDQISFYETEYNSKDAAVTITPPKSQSPGLYTIIITAKSKLHGYQGKIIVNIRIKP